MKKKGFLMLGILSLAILVLTGCSNQNKNQNQKQEKNQEQEANGNKNENNNRAGQQKSNRQMGPSEEAQNACSGLAEGDSCNFTMTRSNGDKEERTGNCKKLPRDDSSLVCMSDDMRGPGPGGPAANNVDMPTTE